MKFLKLLIVLLVVFSISCEKADECPTDFIVYGSVTPYMETYKIGDTITLSAKFESMVYDQNTKQKYNLTGINLESELYIYKIDTINDGSIYGLLLYVDTIYSSIYNSYIQYFSDGGSMYFSDILFNNNYYQHSMKIILKKKGIYVLTYGPFVLESNYSFNGKCKGISFDLSPRLNKDLDNNINLLKESPDKHFNTWILQKPQNRFYKGRFAYRVVE